MLGRLRSEIERIFRAPSHRTQHAQERHVRGERPTSSAIRDARDAPDERVLRDVRRDTMVVLGPKGRAHLFADDGRHVTSLQLRPGELDRKSSRARWRPVTHEEAQRFRQTLAAGRAQRGQSSDEEAAE
jgi:hypothetical protein